MKKESSFSKEFDELFKKITFRVFVSQHVKTYFAVGVLLISGILFVSLLILPKQLERAVSTLDTSLNKYDKELEKLNDELPYRDTLVLRKEGFKPLYIPDYEKAKTYKMNVANNQINFGNGYLLKINSPNHLLLEDYSKDIQIKAVEGVTHKHQVASVEQLATYILQLTKYQDDYNQKTHQMTYYTDTAYDFDCFASVYISGNLIDNLNVQVSKDKDTFYEVFPMENIGETQSGLIIHATPDHNTLDEQNKVIPKTFVTLYKYWIFPDGVGIYVRQENFFYGHLTQDKNEKNSMDNNLKEIDKFTQIFDGTRSMLAWMNETFELQVSKK